MYWQIKRFFRSNFDPTCITCAIGPVFSLTSFFGGFAGTYKCEHSKSSIFVSHFKTSRIFLLLSVLVTLFNILACCFYGHSIALSAGKKVLLLIYVSELLHIMNALSLNFFNIFGYKQYVLQFNGWINICKINNVNLDLRPVNRFKTLVFCFTFFSTLCQVFFLLHDYYLKRDLDASTGLVTKCAYALVTVLEAAMTSSYNITVILFRITMVRSQELFKRKLANRRKCLVRSIARFQRLHQAFMSNLRVYIKLTSPYFVFWLLTLLLQIIVNVYGYFSTFNDARYSGDLITLELRLMVTCAYILFMLANVERFNNVNNNLLSFLCKYPFSTLKIEEANQLELLIKTLVIQKPLVRASDIFTIGTHLLAPISGIVVTYVLVALQFHEAEVL